MHPRLSGLSGERHQPLDHGRVAQQRFDPVEDAVAIVLAHQVRVLFRGANGDAKISARESLPQTRLDSSFALRIELRVAVPVLSLPELEDLAGIRIYGLRIWPGWLQLVLV